MALTYRLKRFLWGFGVYADGILLDDTVSFSRASRVYEEEKGGGFICFPALLLFEIIGHRPSWKTFITSDKMCL